MNQVKQTLRRSGISIMAHLISLLGSFAAVLILAVINGSIGYLCAMSVTLFGALGVAKALGEPIWLSYEWIIALAVGCGILRGLLRYIEQYSNHYIAFHLLAILRDKIFGVLRKLCPAKLESKQKGSIIAMLTSDIETLEVFYAHTLSPICIAILVSFSVCLFTWLAASPWLALVALIGYLVIGIVVPMISSAALKEPGVTYRREFASFNAYYLDSIKGIKDILFHNAGENREQEVNRRSECLLEETRKMKDASGKAAATTELAVSVFVMLTLIAGIVLVYTGHLTSGKMIIGVVAIFGSFGPVVAISALPGNLTQTFASGDRVLNLLEEAPAVEEITDGKNITYENLEVRKLSFAYQKNEPVLKDVCMQAQKGEIVGIIGESGCGKSTLLKLLLRFWSTQVEMEQACRLASVHDFVMSLPNGYQTRVGAMGDALSSGEKQRLGLARAFLSGRQLILLDEPTSNVDSINEGIILKALAQQKSKKSIILVSHRESTMAIADRIYKMENGYMTEVTK